MVTSNGFNWWTTTINLQQGDSRGNYSKTLYLDAANGVGAPKARLLQSRVGKSLELSITNDGSQGKLNFKVSSNLKKEVTQV